VSYITALFICNWNSKKIKVVYHYLASFVFYLVATPEKKICAYAWLQPTVATCMASSTGNSPEPDETSFSAPIIARLIVHSTASGHGNKKKTTKKDTKTKEFTHTFSATKANYLEFLTAILTKHYISNKLQVTDRRRYTCKMQVPPSK